MEKQIEKSPMLGKDLNLTITKNKYVVSMARDPNGNHAFLILEGLDEKGEHVAWHMDLVVKRGGNNTLDQCLPENWVGGKSVFAYSLNFFKKGLADSPLPLQQAEIRLNPIEDQAQWQQLDDIGRTFLYQSYSISLTKAKKLLADVKEDQSNDEIYYNFSGDGSAHSGSFSGKQHHSCISWAKKCLNDIDVPVTQKWYNWLIVIPSQELPQIK